MKFGKFRPPPEKEEKLEAYLIAADDPIGKSQLRPIFRRKRAREVLTREQVAAIKKGRKLLRKEMKAQGLTRRIDFEVTATNMGLYFDRNRFLWPFFLWLIKENTVMKVLATTAVLTTAVTVSVPVIEYIQEYIEKIVTEYLEKIVTEYEEKEVDRFTVSLSEELFNSGFAISETPRFENAVTNLFADALEGVPCISIIDIPKDVNDLEGQYPDNSFFAYTFYCRYESTKPEPINYYWTLSLTDEQEIVKENPETGESETFLASDAIWVMVFEDNKMTFHAKLGEDGAAESIPAADVTDKGYQGGPMIEFSKEPEAQYEVMKEGEYFDYYRITPKNFVSDTIVADGWMYDVTPFDINAHDPEAEFDPENPNGIHKYTVVIWLEGDDPECTNEIIGGRVGLNFRIQLEEDLPVEEETPEGEETPEEGE